MNQLFPGTAVQVLQQGKLVKQFVFHYFVIGCLFELGAAAEEGCFAQFAGEERIPLLSSFGSMSNTPGHIRQPISTPTP